MKKNKFSKKKKNSQVFEKHFAAPAKKKKNFSRQQDFTKKNSQRAGLIIGKLQVHASGSAHVLSEREGAADLFIAPENTGTALHGDLVEARLIHPRFRRNRSGRLEGEVIRIVERSDALIVGTFQQTKNFSSVVADDPRFLHHFLIVGETLGAKPGEKVVISLERWKHRQEQPEGKIREVLGNANTPEVAMLSVMRKHQLPGTFPEKVLHEAAKYSAKVDAKDLVGREDLRKRLVITIDPENARDFDDAIEVVATKEGWDISVHIADVAHYVLPETLLDQEAKKRGNSIYLVDRVIPMLPENLSNGLCSLRPQEDRLAFSVFASVNRSGKPHRIRFARTVIRSAARLTYEEALAMLQQPLLKNQKKSSSSINSAMHSKIVEQVHTAWECASLLRRQRFEKGSLELDMPEIKVTLDEKGHPIKLERVENDIAHQLIEEFMLLANELVARHLTQHRQATLYRVHEKPDPEKLQEYRELVTSYGMRVGDLTHRQELQKFLNGLRGKPFSDALKIGLLKSLKRARYAPEPLGHYGLQKKDYAHFTSPIRRYADLITHRALARQLGLTKSGPASRDLSALGDHISTTERVAADAEKESIRLKKLDYFETQQQHRKKFRAIVIEARNYGLFVELPDVLISGLVPISSIEDDYYLFDAARSRLVGRRTKRVYRAGDSIDVVIAKVDRWKQQVDFCIAKKK